MTFQRKLKLLMEDRKRGAIAKRVGIHPISLAGYINRGVTPSAEVVVRLARALEVDVGWLIDETRELPVVRDVRVVESVAA